eukprot:m.496998 g.496998  ORF g.496998 m.496998 type:complete len:481 (-) comp21811_c0_seq3:596-2038(-)
MGLSGSKDQDATQESTASGEQEAPTSHPNDGSAAAPIEDEPKMSTWQMLSQGYDELVGAVIRPPRTDYAIEEMGSTRLQWGRTRFQREDVTVQNARGHTLQCSWWTFVPADAPAKSLPCVIYLHGNASCRLGAMPLLRHLLPQAITVFAIDLSGSGLSEGEYVSLGYFERDDVAAAIAYLRASGRVSTIGLWGHSMGATTALLYGDKDPSIACMVLDSPFTDLYQLAWELVEIQRANGMRVPGFAVSIVMASIRRSVRKRAGFDMRNVNPIANCSKCFIPALFAHGEQDEFIQPHHSQKLHDAYAGEKTLRLFRGDHNSPRPPDFFDDAVAFLRRALLVDASHCLDVGTSDSVPGDWMGGSLEVERTQHVHDAEDEMMRRAMALSLLGHNRASSPTGTHPRNGASSPQEEVAIPAHVVAAGVAEFAEVVGVAGRTAAFYVCTALAAGSDVNGAVSNYFEAQGCPPPPTWSPPKGTFVSDA